MKVLAGDIGGTKTWLQVAEFSGVTSHTLAEQRFVSAAYSDLFSMVREFLQSAGISAVDAACFGVAGPVQGDVTRQTVRVTNLPWQLDSIALAQAIGIPKVSLINDFQAAGYGIEALTAADVAVLHPGNPRQHAPRLVVGAGTGFGTAQLIWQQDHYEVFPAEAGHAEFAPCDALQAEFAHYLMQQGGRGFYDRVLSGSGLVNCYEFLVTRQPGNVSAPLQQAIHDEEDVAATITRRALAEDDPLASAALDFFITLYGAWTGSLALITQPRGGVYVAGGIAPRIIQRMRAGSFMQAFLDKGAMTPVVAAMPVQVVLNTKVGLMGAALMGSRL
jgi:glucokinase